MLASLWAISFGVPEFSSVTGWRAKLYATGSKPVENSVHFEQILLISFTFTASSLEELGFVVSLFAIIVLTTFALHKLVMESRIKLLEQEVNELQHEKFALESSFSQAKKGYSSVFEETISKSLNTHHQFGNKTRSKNENR